MRNDENEEVLHQMHVVVVVGSFLRLVLLFLSTYGKLEVAVSFNYKLDA